MEFEAAIELYGFHPSDEALLTYYLTQKNLDNTFSALQIAEVGLTGCEPWDLLGKANMGDNQLYFFHQRGHKYAKGPRVNRSTEAGFWKQTGYDHKVFDSQTKELVGKKKKLVFYTGRHPSSGKTNWIMDEYSLGGIFPDNLIPQKNKGEWVLCRVFERCEDPKKTPTGRKRKNSSLDLDQQEASLLPSFLNATNSSSQSSSINSTSVSDEKTTGYSTSVNDHEKTKGCMCDNPACMLKTMPNYPIKNTNLIHLSARPNFLSNLGSDQNLPVTYMGGFDITGLQANFGSTLWFSDGNQQQQINAADVNEISENILAEPYISYTGLLLMQSPFSSFEFPDKEGNEITNLGNSYGSIQWQWLSEGNYEQQEIKTEAGDDFYQSIMGGNNIEQADGAQILKANMREDLVGHGDISLTPPLVGPDN